MKAHIGLIALLFAGCVTEDIGTSTSEIIIHGKGTLVALQDGVCTPGDVAQLALQRTGGPHELAVHASNFTIEGTIEELPPDPDHPPDADIPPDPGKLTFVVRDAAGVVVFDSRRVR